MTGAAQAQPVLLVSQVEGAAGSRVSFTGTLEAGGRDVAAVQADISFDPFFTPIAGVDSGNPECTLNPDLGRSGVFALQPPSCMNTECTAIRVAVIPMFPITALPQVVTLFTCAINIAANAPPGVYPLALSKIVFSDLEGIKIADGTGADGNVTVLEVPTPTPTPTPTPQPCAGDCNGDRDVPINELVALVNIALGNFPVSQCPPGDVNGNGEITIDEILQAVNAALSGCPSL